jgi:hypothetical protein
LLSLLALACTFKKLKLKALGGCVCVQHQIYNTKDKSF